MQLGWNDEERQLHDRYRKLGAEIAQARQGAAIDAFDHDGWRRLKDAGLWRIAIPQAFGGDERGWWAFTAALEGLASGIRTPALVLSVIAQAGLIRAMTEYGSPAQREKYFGALLRGELGVTAIAEPTTGTDVRSIGTVLEPHGDGYVLSGDKFNIAHAPVADFSLVVAKLTGAAREGVTLVMLDKDAPGIHAGPPDTKFGNRALPTGPIRYENTPVSREQILGEPGRGLQQLIDIISLGRLYYGLVSAAIAEPYVEEALDYVAARTSFGEPVAAHQYVQKRVVDARIGIERTRWLAYAALDQLLNRRDGSVMLCSIAKLVGANDLIDTAISLVRLRGSTGYHEGELAVLARDALGFASVGGTEEMHRKNIFNQMQRLHARANGAARA
ncbi:acyl-CoA dehydrogenase family protein [Burkholderia perseverans]|uniref:acyl-CoA dehydrogenase family protein n=1 Tax=Burkholderia perseverans TaxID=2615214 RepID=UPI001FEDF3EE|nr:acyl-CoA dehydrogenase family protein [Burkholderia perseverans]